MGEKLGGLRHCGEKKGRLMAISQSNPFINKIFKSEIKTEWRCRSWTVLKTKFPRL